MRRKMSWASVLVLVMTASVWDAPPVRAAVTVDDVELVSRTRVGRTTFNYTYRVTATNRSPVQIDDAVAYLSLLEPDASPDPTAPADAVGVLQPTVEYGEQAGTELLDDTVTLGSIAPGASITSTDTFVLQQDRRFPLDTDSLLWEVGFTANVELSGIVTDTVIPNANLTIEIDRTESGRPIVESGRPIVEFYQAIADEEGRYVVNVDFVSDKDFVDISALGVGDLDFVALRSIVGSAGSLLGDATDGPLQVSSDEVNALNITHVSTALADLAIEINGGEDFSNDEDLAAAQALVNGDELIINAAVIKTVIDNPNIDLPPGVTNTQELLDAPDIFDAFLEDLEENFPEELEEAIEETIIDISTGYRPEDVPETLYLSFARERPLINGARVFTLNGDGSASVIDFAGETTDADWLLNAEGEIIVALNNPPTLEDFPNLEVPPGSGNFQQVRRLRSTIEYRVIRVAVGLTTDQVLLASTSLETFPDGELPDATIVGEPNPESDFVAYGPDGVLPVVDSELAGTDVVLTYFHRDNNSVGLNDPEAGADVLSFDADGTGTTQRRGFAFDWETDEAGRLFVTFANGDRNEYARYASIEPDGISLGVLVARYGAGDVSATDLIAIEREAPLPFDASALTNQKFLNALSVSDPEIYGLFSFSFLPGGVGCRTISGFANDFLWSFDPPGTVKIQRFSGPTLNRQRSWTPVIAAAGTLGPRYWVIEHLDFNSNPGFPNDTSVTPGRLSYYENTRNIAVNTAPTPVDDSVTTSIDTPIIIDVLANDTDADGDSLALINWSQSALGGAVVSVFDGSGVRLRYTPPAGASGITDSFTYTIADDACAVSLVVGTVTITIPAVRGAAIEYRGSGSLEPRPSGVANP